MPLHMEPLDVASDLEGCRSVLIVSCPVCPPVSLAVREGRPLIELFKHGIKTGAYQDFVKGIREGLEERGVRTGALCMYTPLPTMCLWTKGQRRRLARRARGYEAVLVMGCDSALHTAQQVLADTDCRVVLGMRMNGLTNAVLEFHFPGRVELQEKARVGAGGEVERA